MNHAPGTKLVLDIIEDVARNDPNPEVARGIDVWDGYRTVSMADLRNAVFRASEFLQSHIRSSIPTTFAYTGPQDLRYVLMVLAGTKLGHVAFLLSLRNSAEAHVQLFDAYRCSTLFVAGQSQARHSLDGLLTARSIRVIETPDMEHFLFRAVDEPHILRSGIKEDRRRRATPLVALQTSGSTGSPKPIIMPQQCLMAVDAYRRLSDMGLPFVLFSRFKGKRMLLAFPFFMLPA